jgi:hypothetical protein
MTNAFLLLTDLLVGIRLAKKANFIPELVDCNACKLQITHNFLDPLGA